MNLRQIPLLVLAIGLAGCSGSRGIQNENAVRQGVYDYLAKRSDLNMSAMQIDVTSVSFRQNEADATVSFRAKGTPASASFMSMRYTLERQGSRWVVKGHGRGPAGTPPHGQGMGGQNPHGMGQPMPGGQTPAPGSESNLPPGQPPVGGSKPSGAK